MLCNVKVSWQGQAVLRWSEAHKGASGALTLTKPKADWQCCIYKPQKVQRPMKLFLPGFALGIHSYDEQNKKKLRFKIT